MKPRPKTDAIDSDARQEVDNLLGDAVAQKASDVHLEPVADGYEIRYRIDGLLAIKRHLSLDTGRAMANRLMVAAQLLTYRAGIPQEGRISVDLPHLNETLDLRLSVMPTTRGLRAVVRLPAELIQPRMLDQLDLPESVMAGIRDYIHADSGMLILCGPAGSGKTTTIYAVLEAIRQARPGLSLISLEDPVERSLAGVTQIEIQPFGELTFEKVLRSVLRQDPQVLAVGEVRDPQTAGIVTQAALSGHQLITTLHAPTPEAAIVRLIEMGIEPYQVASAVAGVVSIRLARRVLDPGGDPSGDFGEDSGEDSGVGSGVYSGRAPLAEFAGMTAPLRQAVLECEDAGGLRRVIETTPGFVSIDDNARQQIDAGITDAQEVDRVLGRRA